MNGFHVLDRAGWDMHGLPIEVKVEGVLGFKIKKTLRNMALGISWQNARNSPFPIVMR